jgi:hypothetical protein
MPYGKFDHMAAILIYRSKYVYPDGAIREMVLWKLPKKMPKSSHRFKYRLYYGLADGTCLVRYDNETAKGDHRQIDDKEESYRFKDVETLVADFLRDIVNGGGGGQHEKKHST